MGSPAEYKNHPATAFSRLNRTSERLSGVNITRLGKVVLCLDVRSVGLFHQRYLIRVQIFPLQIRERSY